MSQLTVPDETYERLARRAAALNLTVEELPNRIDDLPRDKRIVAYCRGPYCLFADEAVALLQQNGFDAVRMEGGWPDWHIEEGEAR